MAGTTLAKNPDYYPANFPTPDAIDNMSPAEQSTWRMKAQQIEATHTANYKWAGTKSENQWGEYVREGGTSPWGVSSSGQRDQAGYLQPLDTVGGEAVDAAKKMQADIDNQKAALKSAQGSDGGGYPAMQNQYGLGQNSAPAPTGGTSVSANPWGSPQAADSGSHGYTPYSLRGEANYR